MVGLKREFFPDIAFLRVISILLVLLGVPAAIVIDELGSGLAHWSFSLLYDYFDGFIIPLFIFISGYMLRVARSAPDAKGTEAAYILKRVKRFLPPYLAFGLLTAISFLIIGRYTLEDVWMTYPRDFLLSVNPAHLWFLLGLVMTMVLHLVLRSAVKDQYVILAIVLVLFMREPLLDTRVLQVRNGLRFLTFFHLGYMARIHLGQMRARTGGRELLLLFLCAALSLLLYVWSVKVGFVFVPNAFLERELHQVQHLALALSGIAYMFFFAKISVRTLPRLLDPSRMQVLSQYLFGVYLVHLPVLLLLMEAGERIDFNLIFKGIIIYFLGTAISFGLVAIWIRSAVLLRRSPRPNT